MKQMLTILAAVIFMVILGAGHRQTPVKAAVVKVPSAPSKPGLIPIHFVLKEPGNVTLVIDNSRGQRVRNLISDTPFSAGPHTVWWNGKNDLGRDTQAAAHYSYHVPGTLVAPGTYTVRGLVHSPLKVPYEFNTYTHGDPPWQTTSGNSSWLADHSPPHAVCFVPAGRVPLRSGEVFSPPEVLVGSWVSENSKGGLAWLNLRGKKLFGVRWIGGNWTSAPFLAAETGRRPIDGTYGFVGAYAPFGWSIRRTQVELRLTALTSRGEEPVLTAPYKFPTSVAPSGAVSGRMLSGIAARNGILAASLTALNRVLIINARRHQVLGYVPLRQPRGLVFDPAGQLLVLSGHTLVRLNRLAKNFHGRSIVPQKILIPKGLENPQGITLDRQGNIYISDWGNSQQVKVFSRAGKFLRAIGDPGRPRAGIYNPRHMNHPEGIAIDSLNHLWVAEDDFRPKRVSVWSLHGKLLHAFYGPTQYGGGGMLDPRNRNRFYYDGMKFDLNWKKGLSNLVAVTGRPGKDRPVFMGGQTAGLTRRPPIWARHVHGRNYPETVYYADGRKYITNGFQCNAIGAAPAATVFLLKKDGLSQPVAMMGQAAFWPFLRHLLSTKNHVPRPRGTKAWLARLPKGANSASGLNLSDLLFLWVNRHGSGVPRPDDVSFRYFPNPNIYAAMVSGVTVEPNLSFVVSNVGGQAMRYAPQGFSSSGVPLYSLKHGTVLATHVQNPAVDGGGQTLAAPDGWVVMTTPPQPYSRSSVGGVKDGQPMWSYPSLWSGLGASERRAPIPDHHGELIGTTRLLGPFIKSSVGPVWGLNGNMGQVYLFTANGLFVSSLFRDYRVVNAQPLIFEGWPFPAARRGMDVSSGSLGCEDFWVTMSQVPGGAVYLQGQEGSLMRLHGLSTLHRLPNLSLAVSRQQLVECSRYLFARARRRQQQLQPHTAGLTVPILKSAPLMSGQCAGFWQSAAWVVIDRRQSSLYGWASHRTISTKAAVAVTHTRLYAAFKTDTSNLADNAGTSWQHIFSTGGGLDLMIDPNAGVHANWAKVIAGDERLVVAMVKGKVLAVLFRQVGSKVHPHLGFTYTSPAGSVHFAMVKNVSRWVRLVQGPRQFKGGMVLPDAFYVLSIPLKVLKLNPRPGTVIKADIGILFGNGCRLLGRAGHTVTTFLVAPHGKQWQTPQRVYWNNKAPLMATIPDQARLLPQFWGNWKFQ